MSQSSELPFYNFLPISTVDTNVNEAFRQIDDSLRWLFENSDAGDEEAADSDEDAISDAVDSLAYFLGE